MLAAFAELEKRGRRALWGVFGYGSDGELSTDEIERALSRLAAAGGIAGAWGERNIRGGERKVKLTPLTTLTFFMAPTVVFETLSPPARAASASASLEQANDALHALGIKTELDLERERYRRANAGR